MATKPWDVLHTSAALQYSKLIRRDAHEASRKQSRDKTKNSQMMTSMMTDKRARCSCAAKSHGNDSKIVDVFLGKQI